MLKFIFANTILSVIFNIFSVEAGHEVLYKYESKSIHDIKPEELAVIQFDSRAINTLNRHAKVRLKYWQVSARWNKAFCKLHGHKYYYLSLRRPSSCSITTNYTFIHDEKTHQILSLADPWCKVKALRQFDEYLHGESIYADIKAVLFIDSDAIITLQFNHSLHTAINYARSTLKWDINRQPVALNQDGPGWACKNTLRRGYSLCLNSGTVLWFRSSLASEILQFWWQSAADPLASEMISGNGNGLDIDGHVPRKQCSVEQTDKWPRNLELESITIFFLA